MLSDKCGYWLWKVNLVILLLIVRYKNTLTGYRDTCTDNYLVRKSEIKIVDAGRKRISNLIYIGSAISDKGDDILFL